MYSFLYRSHIVTPSPPIPSYFFQQDKNNLSFRHQDTCPFIFRTILSPPLREIIQIYVNILIYSLFALLAVMQKHLMYAKRFKQQKCNLLRCLFRHFICIIVVLKYNHQKYIVLAKNYHIESRKISY